MGIQARLAARVAKRLPGDHKLSVDDFIIYAASNGMGLTWSRRRWRDMSADLKATEVFCDPRFIKMLKPSQRLQVLDWLKRMPARLGGRA